jgi:hypothetical protein
MESFVLPELQARTLIIMIRAELRSGMKMRYGGETPLQAFKRLTGVDPGRGTKGLQKALDILTSGVPDQE